MFFHFVWLNHTTQNDCLKKKKRHALKNDAYTTNFQPLNSDLSPFYAFSVLSPFLLNATHACFASAAGLFFDCFLIYFNGFLMRFIALNRFSIDLHWFSEILVDFWFFFWVSKIFSGCTYILIDVDWIYIDLHRFTSMFIDSYWFSLIFIDFHWFS